MKGWESREHERSAEFSARAKAAGWAATRMGYRQRVHLVLNDKRVLLQEAPNHVPVLAQDLQYMLDELIELDNVRSAPHRNRYCEKCHRPEPEGCTCV